MSSPRLWGCFRYRTTHVPGTGVFPTPVGVFLRTCTSKRIGSCLPHACGGVSNRQPLDKQTGESSPRLWGCFLHTAGCGGTVGVFPTPVGVFPQLHGRIKRQMRLPHACGGVSKRVKKRSPKLTSSPRLWGCFQENAKMAALKEVFPTPVGVFPCMTGLTPSSESLPHACGGVSETKFYLETWIWSSPRLWGCF